MLHLDFCSSPIAIMGVETLILILHIFGNSAFLTFHYPVNSFLRLLKWQDKSPFPMTFNIPIHFSILGFRHTLKKIVPEISALQTCSGKLILVPVSPFCGF